MMQAMECVDDPREVNYRSRSRVVERGMDGPEVDRIYPRPSEEVMYRQNLRFVDPNELGGQVYPGFPLTPRTLED